MMETLQERIARVTAMEARLDLLKAAAKQLPSTKEEFMKLYGELVCLTEYYENGQWLSDYEADERGEFPKDLKRGVLSQDAVYDLLCEIQRIKEHIKQLSV